MAVTLGTNQSIIVCHHELHPQPKNIWLVPRRTDRLHGSEKDRADRGESSAQRVWDVVLLITNFLQWNTHAFGNLDRRRNWQDSKGFGLGAWVGAWVPVSCQAAGGSRAKRLRQCDWAAVTLARSILTLFCCGSVLCERNFSCLNWCQTI